MLLKSSPNIKNILLRILIAAGILAASAVYGMLVPRMIQSKFIVLVLVLPVLAAGTLLLLRWPPLGLLAILVSDLLVPFAIGTGSQTTLGAPILMLAGCTGLWILDGLVHKRGAGFLKSRAVIPLFVFLLVALLAFFNGQLPWFAGVSHAPIRAQLGGLALFFMSGIAFLIVGSQVRSEAWLRAMVWTFLGVSAIYFVGRLVPQVSNYTGHFFVNDITGSLFWVWVVSLSLSQALLNKKLTFPWRIALGMLALAALYVGLVNNSWTSGWLPAGVGAGVIIFIGLPRFGLPAAIAAGITYIATNERATHLVMQGDNVYSLGTRLDAWTILLRMVKSSPVLGFGPSNYYWYTPLFPIRGYSVVFNSHNNYIDLLAQVGVLGLGCFLWFAGSLWRLAWQLRSRVPEGFQKAYVIGALGGLAGTLAAGMLGDWVIPFVYNIGYTGFRASLLGWMFLGGLVSLDLMNPKDGRIPLG